MVSKRDEVVIEDANIYWLNFAGEKRRFNEKGERNFHVDLEPDLAKKLFDTGFNIKWHEPREEGEDPVAHVEVKVQYDKGRPPNIVVVTGITGNRTRLNKETVEMLDSVDMLNVDLIFTPFPWEVNGKTGIAAYLKTMFVTIDEDFLEQKYAVHDDQED